MQQRLMSIGSSTTSYQSFVTAQTDVGPFRDQLVAWKNNINSSFYVPTDDFFPDTNEMNTLFQNARNNLKKIGTIFHEHQKNLIIGVGGLFNLDIALARMQAMPDRHYFVLLVDIQDGYEKFWQFVFDIFETTEHVADAVAKFDGLMDMCLGIMRGSESFTPAFLASQENYDQIRDLVIAHHVLFSTLDMRSREHSSKLRAVIDAFEYHVDTYNVSNVAGSSDYSDRFGNSQAYTLAAAVSQLVMSNTILVASKIYHSSWKEGDEEYSSLDGLCVQSIIPFDEDKSLADILNHPQKYERTDWFLQEMQACYQKFGSYGPSHLLRIVQKMPHELTIPLFKELIQQLIGDNPPKGLAEFAAFLKNDHSSVEREKQHYRSAAGTAIQEMLADADFPAEKKEYLQALWHQFE